MVEVERLQHLCADSGGSDLLILLRDTRKWMLGRYDSYAFLDSVSIQRKSTFTLHLPLSADIRAIPLLWLRKSNSFTGSPVGDMNVGQLESRHNFTGLDVRDASNQLLGVIPRREAEELLFAACWHLSSELLPRALDAAGPMGHPEQEQLSQELWNLISKPVPIAWERLKRHLVQIVGQNSGRSLLLTQLLGFSVFRQLAYDCVLSTPLLVNAGKRSGSQVWTLGYVASQLWQRRTLKASLGLEPIGIEFDIPRIGAARCFSAEIERPEGSEIIGCEIRYTSSQQSNPLSHFIKKAPRRTFRRISHEFVTSRNTRWRSQDRTRFGQRLRTFVLDFEPSAQGAATVWLSFERRSIRPALWAVGIVALTMTVLFWHLRILGAPVHDSGEGLLGWHWGIWHLGKSTVARYRELTGLNSSAAVTALIAPGAFASFLVRPTEHTILSQFLRVSRALVLACALVLYLAALLVALAAAEQTFANLLTFGGMMVTFLFLLIALSYRNCERLPARPSPYGRWLVARHRRLGRWADEWLRQNATPDDDSRSQHRKRMKANRWASATIGPVAPISLTENIAMVDRAMLELTSALERSTKDPRLLPFGVLDDRAVYRVRLNRIDGVEVPLQAPPA